MVDRYVLDAELRDLDPDGAWVEYYDYAALERERDELRKDVEHANAQEDRHRARVAELVAKAEALLRKVKGEEEER